MPQRGQFRAAEGRAGFGRSGVRRRLRFHRRAAGSIEAGQAGVREADDRGPHLRLEIFLGLADPTSEFEGSFVSGRPAKGQGDTGEGSPAAEK